MDLLENLMIENPAVFKSQLGLIRATSLAAMVNTMTLAYSWITIDLLRNDKEMKITQSMENDLLSYIPLGAAFGCLGAIFLLNVFGRRNSLIVTSLCYAFTWLTIASATEATTILRSRLMLGICLGIQSTAATVYAAETIICKFKPLAHIGRTACGGAGIFFLIFARSYLEYDWRNLAKILVVLSLSAGFCFLTLPCSPYRMFTRYGRDACMTSLRWTMIVRENCQQQISLLEDICFRGSLNQVTVKDVFTNVSANTLGLFMIVIQQLTGVYLIVYHSNTLFVKILGKASAVNGVFFIGSLDALFYIMSSLLRGYTRKSIICNTNRFIPIALFLLWLYFLITDYFARLGYMHYTILTILSCNAVGVLALFVAAFHLGWGKVTEEYLVEGLAIVQKELVCGILLATKWSIAYALSISFPFMFHTIGFGWIFLFLAGGYLFFYDIIRKDFNERRGGPRSGGIYT